MLDVDLYKIADAGHFWCKPASRNKKEAEKYYTLIGKINDHCCKIQTKSSNESSSIPKKGKICLVKRTSDRCWYRAKILSVFQTTNGPQARVLLVDLGERTLVPGIWVQEIPDEFLNIPYQTMECVLSGLKPLTMVTSYFDLITKQQPGETWDISATDWLKKQIACCNLQVDVKHIDEDGIHHVLLFRTSPDSNMLCLNDELVNKEYAIVSKSAFEASKDQETPKSIKDRSQELFSEELKDMQTAMNESLNGNFSGNSFQSNESFDTKQKKYQPYEPSWSEESEQGSENEFGKHPISAREKQPIRTHVSSDEERNKVRFMSARMPATGSGGGTQPRGQPKPILKHSSGYSSAEDSLVYRQSNSRVAEPGIGAPRIDQRKVSLNDLYNKENLSSQVEESYSYFARVQNTDVTSQNVIPSGHNQNMATSQTPLQTSSDQYPGYAMTDRQRHSASYQMSTNYKTDQVSHSQLSGTNIVNYQVQSPNAPMHQATSINASSYQTPSTDLRSYQGLCPDGSNYQRQASDAPNYQVRSTNSNYQTQFPNAPSYKQQSPNASTYQAPSTNVPKYQGQSTNTSADQRQFRNPPSHQEPSSNAPVYQGQSSNAPPAQPVHQNLSQLRNTLTSTPQVTNYQAQSTAACQAPLQQYHPPRQPQYVVLSSPEYPPLRMQHPNSPTYQTQSQSAPNYQAQSLLAPNCQAQSPHVLASQKQPRNFAPREQYCVTSSTSTFTKVPNYQDQPNRTHEHKIQLSQDYLMCTPAPSNEPTSLSSLSTQYSSAHQQSPNVARSMAQSFDILSDRRPPQHLPTGLPTSRIPNNQAQCILNRTQASAVQERPPVSYHPTPNYQAESNTAPPLKDPHLISYTSQCKPNNQTQSQHTPPSSTHQPARGKYFSLNPVQSPPIQNDPTTSQHTPDYQEQPRYNISSQNLPNVQSPNTPFQSTPLQKSPAKSPRIPASPLPDPKLCNLAKDIFIHGEGLPRSLTEINSTLPDGVQRGLRDLCVTKISSFQSVIWPAIIRGRDVFGIPETGESKTMTYLAPVITRLAEPAAYSELPIGNGALALILCKGWRKATTVYEQCRKLTKNVQRKIRVQIVYGAGAEDECIPNLINGCEILVATLPCLMRLLKMKITRLDRLCHLVFDDADILAEQQTKCIRDLMRDYCACLETRRDRLASRQIVVIGNKWTAGVSSLVRAYLGMPLIMIGNQIEAALFCKVRQIVTYVSSSKRDSELLSLLDKYTLNNEHEIIVFTSTAKNAERLEEMLRCYSFTVLLAHEFKCPERLNEVRVQWNTPRITDSLLLLIMTDGVIDKCNIRTASCVIHYDAAPSKKLFGKRMFCMAASYPSNKDRECLSFTIGTESSTNCARSLKELVQRSSGAVPPTLEEICEYSYHEKEKSKKNDELCVNLKAFGQCKDLLQCKSRHTVFPDVDLSKLLPKSGIVKVLILAVLDASRFFVRILEHHSEKKGVVTTSKDYSGATFLKLALDLNSLYTSHDNRRVCSQTSARKLCVVESEGSYYRAKIIETTKKDPENNRALEVQVYFIDRGFYEVVQTQSLFEIAPQFKNIPYQAIEAYVCRVKPVDNDEHWTNKACRFVARHIEGQELEGRVVMGVRNTIWLDPLVSKEHLKEINVTTNKFNVRLDLIKEGLAVNNQKHIENLLDYFSSFVPLNDIADGESFPRCSDFQQVETCTLPEHDFEMVQVSFIVSPELLYVKLYANNNWLEDFVDEITSEIQGQPKTQEKFNTGALCLALDPEDERWHRARILSIRPERECEVFFVDHGGTEWISEDEIAPMRPQYLEYPFQAIECSLANISAVGSDWTADDVEALWKLTEQKLLHAKVKSKTVAMLAGTTRYVIELYDTSTERDVLVNHELVIAGHAQATLEYHKTLFPEAFETDKTGRQKEQYQEIPMLCLELYRAQDPNVKLRYAQEIKNIVSEYMKKKDDIRESGGVRCICRLLGVVKNEIVLEYIVITLSFLATQNELNCDEIRREGGLKILCGLLAKVKNVKIQEHVSWALKNLAISERNCNTTREIGGIKSLCDLLASTDQERVQENICWAIVSLCSDNDQNCDAIREAGGLGTLFKLLETTRNESVLENTIWALSLLAYNVGNKKFIGEQGGIEKIYNLIRSNQNEKIIQNAVRTLKTLSSYNDENRDIMCRWGVIDLMRRFSSSHTQLPFDTRRICLDLIQRLLGRAPDVPLLEASSMTSPLQEPIRCKPISVTKKRKVNTQNGKIMNGSAESGDEMPMLEDTTDLSRPTVHPMTMWSQTKHFVSLSIKLRGVQEKVTNITENTFYFRTKHMDKLYEIDWKLFANIIPKESKVQLRGSEVLVSFKKATPVTWPRLLLTTEKPPFLSVDFDRWDTDSDSEERDEKPRSKVPLNRDSKVVPRHFDDTKSDSNEDSSDYDVTQDGLDFAF